MSHSNAFPANSTCNGKHKKEFEKYTFSNFIPNNNTNGFGNLHKSAESIDSLRCTKKFENLHDFLLKVSKTLCQLQSFYSMDFADVLCKIQRWRKTLPDIEMFYAVKANPDPLLLKLLVLMGTSFDCATEGEIEKVLKAGAAPKNILWAHTVKSEDGLLYARSMGVDMMSFDSEDELMKIHRLFPEGRLLLRIRPSTIRGVKYDLSKKFGCSISEALQLLALAKQLKMNVLGISFHVGALCKDPECFASAIRDCREIFDQAREISDCRFSVLDIGGGFFGASGTEDIFIEMAEAIKKALIENFPNGGVRVIAEPGCFVVGSAEKLVCRVIGKRRVQEASGNIQNHYFLNNSIYGSFFKKMESYDIRMKPLLPEYEVVKRRKYDSILFGLTCCSEDIIERNQYLPDLEMGEHVVWENMGAYSGAACTSFCSIPLPAKVYVFEENEELSTTEIFKQEDIRNFIESNAVHIGTNTLE